MKKIFCFFLFVFLGTIINAQDELTNLQKYWHYRYRLVNYFMVVGEGSGMSLPADIRNRYNGNILDWGESPVYLGYYIGVLATEYRLLKDNGQNTDRTLTELYYALEASVRIDEVAESYPAWNQTNSIDGFLIRDDVPANFVQQHLSELNLNIPSQQGIMIGSGVPGEVTTTSSTYADHLNNDQQAVAVSQDVIYQLLMGFALVTRYIDAGFLSFNNYITNTSMQIDLKGMSIDEADKIVSFIKENHGHHWVIHDPNDNAVVGGNNLDMASLSYALALSGTYITGTNYNDFHTDPLAWQSLQDPSVLLCDVVGNQWSVHPMAMTLAAMSDSWRNLSGINTTPDQILTLGDYDAGGLGACSYFDNHFGWDVFYGMLWDSFYGGETFAGNLCKARDVLNSAFWDGPFYHDVNGDKAYPGWCATRRFFDDSPRQNNGKPGFEGNYNGLDYMLLFNLYYLDAKQQITTFYVPQNSPYVSDHYPYLTNNGITGDISDPAQIFSPTFPVIVNQLSATANSGPVSGLGNLTIYGGPQGILFTNTSVERDATLSAFCTDVNASCTPLQSYSFDQSSYHRLMNPDSGGNTTQLVPYTVADEFKEVHNKNSFSIFPNPATGSVFISNIIPGSKISLLNLSGQVIKEDNAENSTLKMNLENITSGIYFIQMENAGEKTVRKLIVQ